MTAREHGQGRPEAPIHDELVDAFFDRELGEGDADAFFARLRTDLPRCAEVAQVQRAISLLREPIEAPDVTHRVLSAMSRGGRFIPERWRRMVTTGRLVAAGVGLAAVLGIAIVDRANPGFFRLSAPARPVGGFVSSTAAEARQGVAHLAGSVDPVRAPGEGAVPARGGGILIQALKPGVTSAKLLPRTRPGEDDSIIVYRGSGPDTRFILPEAVIIDKNAAIVLPLGHMSPSRIGAMDWAGVTSQNLFLLPAVEPEHLSGAEVVPERAKEKPAPDR